MTQLYDSIDVYCERTGPDLWSEPVNAVTNLAFLLAAGLLLRDWLACYRQDASAGWDRLLLIVLVALIGIGSGLFHTYAQYWSALADVLPIAAFISVYLLVFLKRIAVLGWWATAAWFAAYHLMNGLLRQQLPADFLNGSVAYLPSGAALLAMASWLAWRRHSTWPRFAQAAALFLVSLGFRTADMALCPAWPLGTHFLWHLLNALLLWLLVRAVLERPPAVAQSAKLG